MQKSGQNIPGSGNYNDDDGDGDDDGDDKTANIY